MDPMPEELADRSWRPERAVPICDALDLLLDDLEARYTHDEPELPPDPLPLGTGVNALDRVLGGGVHLGTVTLLEADLTAQADALLYSVARRIEHPTLLDTPSLLHTARWMMAGSASVPAVWVESGRLSRDDWRAIADNIGGLAARDLLVSATGSLQGLAHLVSDSDNDADVVLVQDISRFGPTVATVAALCRLATNAGVAILATTTPLGELPPAAFDRIERVLVLDHCLGSKATLVHPDPLEMLATVEIDVECLTGTAG